ncbi:cytochrome d ubiquinol oxidase subunit II [Halomonas sp. McH1-25]|uniref:cytochrome d ubiquinol oxidase subunit II n=1 Tax=unclassified Halomonas TaxID=2609666 RepID=UPI001EF3D69C|nr:MULTISPECIES: cytochrome d ubiquinol oxidase subunit II [unclassified Halomonas]MCG7600839.1 cytochrome d ubiquinol oxidase subunit II [Halomonas sp. McH1-25]MCP1344405.1 cytochrome d ubiquinol oxidase subunit II [Halomonas sp. FL8]MCP1362419.1 cytochrome d ubiquinol oxidase subunit II [Halomonas sp. BBD45]MCP1366096.1 cytochrome d ubiquinol oxidase subunit II [Halomonas sp. BBD48]
MDSELFPVIWFGLIGFALILYVILDGYSLGIGILFPFVRDDEQRGIMLTSASPFWDGNQTWLVLSAAGLYGAFPLVYSSLLPAMYLPLILMLMCLFFRGMTFEFRSEADSHKTFDTGFCLVTIAVAFIQGMIVGSVIAGLDTDDGNFAENALSGFSWFGLCTGIALVLGYALLGAAWLIVKTDGRLQRRFYHLIRPLTILFMLAMLAVVVWTPCVNERIAARWSMSPNLLWLGLIAAIMLALAIATVRGATRRYEKRLFAQVVAMFVLGLVGLVASLYPVMLPPDITLWDAASSRSSQQFLLVGYGILLPIILGYTAYSYWVFRGKVRESEE